MNKQKQKEIIIPENIYFIDFLKELYCKYEEDMKELLFDGEYTAKDTVLSLIGMGKVQNSHLHVDLYHAVEATVNEYLKRNKDNINQEEVFELVSIILGINNEMISSLEAEIQLGINSTHGLAISLVNVLSRENAEAVFIKYAEQRNIREMLPRQREVYNTLLEKSGIKAKKARKSIFAK